MEDTRATVMVVASASSLARWRALVSIISQWSPHKSELCATRGEVPYGTSDPEKQRVAKDPQSPTSQLFTGSPPPSLIDFNNRLRGGRKLSFIGQEGAFPRSHDEHCST